MARSRKMREGECRLTKNGQKYCKRRGKVKFVKGGSRSRSRSRPRSRPRPRRRSGSLGNLGRTCVRFKRVQVKGTRGKQRRCAQYN